LRRRASWLWLLGLGVTLLIVALVLGYHEWQGRIHAVRPAVLSYMPAGGDTVIYADLTALRHSPFLARLLSLAPSAGMDADYAGFVQATGFDYARDLDRAALAVIGHGQRRVLFAVADGRFDYGKITAYALKTGRREMIGGYELFRTPMSGASKEATFSFLSPGRIALTDGQDMTAFVSFFTPQADNPGSQPWHERFVRLAGSPVFLVSSLSASNGAMLATRPASGFRSEQLGTFAGSLRWGTVGLRPDGDALRIVAEAECANDESASRLSDTASGLTLFARAQLTDPKTQRQLDPETLAALEEMLRTVDISRIDRGETKGVRLVFSVTTRVLDAAARLNRTPGQ